jgi:hypothetical protein
MATLKRTSSGKMSEASIAFDPDSLISAPTETKLWHDGDYASQ